jgi:hypothetical protein
MEERAPHPNPLPVKNGEREKRPRSSYTFGRSERCMSMV